LDEAADSLASELAGNAPLAIQRGMSAFYNLKNLSPEKHHSYLYDQLQELLKTQDAAEGINAFSEKRKPVWKGN
jgi:enoyl-CoA hydratase/carnithine racemase